MKPLPGLPDRVAAVQMPIIPTVADWIRQHPGTISMGQGVVSYGPPPEVAPQLLRFQEDPNNHKYQGVQGLPELTALFTEKLAAENGIVVGPEQQNAVIVTAGSNMGFVNAVLAIAGEGDEVILQTPYYFNHEMAIQMLGCRPILVPTDSQYQLQVEAIRNAITARTRAIVTVSPNNPTGAVYPESVLREVNDLCREQGLYHIHDAAYEYFTYDGETSFSPGSLPGASPHTLSLFSLSKAYGFASWRIGFMVMPRPLLDSVRKIQDTNLVCPPVISQYAAIGALQAGRPYCLEQLKEIKEVRQIVLNELSTMTDYCEVPPARGAFYFLLRLRRDCEPVALTEALIARHGVAVIPGTAFGLTPEEGRYIRIAYGTLNRDTAREGVGRLVEGLKALL